MQTHLLEYQRKNRHSMPAPEVVLWQQLRQGQLGIKFRRQYAIENRIFDFYAPALRLGIEVDGDSHFWDAGRRSGELASDEQFGISGIVVLRFYNSDVMKNLRGVIEKISEVIEIRRPNPHLNPPPAGRGRKPKQNSESSLFRRKGEVQVGDAEDESKGGVGGGLTIVLAISFFLLFAVPRVTRAARLTVGSNAQTVGVGELVLVTVALNAEDEEVNAVEGTVTYSGDMLELVEMRDGDSLVSFWIQRPELPVACASLCEVSWSGVVPGGYAGRTSPVFTLFMKARAAGDATIDIKNAKVLRNDGRGSVAALRISNFQFQISNTPSPQSLVPSPAPDTTPPETFTPLVTRDAAVYDNAWFVVFAAQDKESGIDHYEVKEPIGGKAEFIRAESPYLLRSQRPSDAIIVRAVDRSGNQRDAQVEFRVPPGADNRVFGNWPLVLFLGAVLIAGVGRFILRRGRQ